MIFCLRLYVESSKVTRLRKDRNQEPMHIKRILAWLQKSARFSGKFWTKSPPPFCSLSKSKVGSTLSSQNPENQMWIFVLKTWHKMASRLQEATKLISPHGVKCLRLRGCFWNQSGQGSSLFKVLWKRPQNRSKQLSVEGKISQSNSRRASS